MCKYEGTPHWKPEESANCCRPLFGPVSDALMTTGTVEGEVYVWSAKAMLSSHPPRNVEFETFFSVFVSFGGTGPILVFHFESCWWVYPYIVIKLRHRYQLFISAIKLNITCKTRLLMRIHVILAIAIWTMNYHGRSLVSLQTRLFHTPTSLLCVVTAEFHLDFWVKRNVCFLHPHSCIGIPTPACHRFWA